MIQTRGLSVRYQDGRLALNHLSFTVGAGEIYCLLGPNGAGKTTLLNTFLGLVAPATGIALVGGTDCARESAEAKKKFAFISERPTLYEYLSCGRNIKLLTRLAGARTPSQDDLTTAMRGVSLPDRVLADRAKVLSPVQRQKLLLAVAIVRQIPALILDDPTGLLDVASSGELSRELRKFKDRGVAVLLMTDDPLVALDLADRIGLLDRGLLTRELDPAATSHKELYEALR